MFASNAYLLLVSFPIFDFHAGRLSLTLHSLKLEPVHK
jgi:hypothetical protein